MAPFVVVYDACVLYPNLLRNLLIRIAQSGLVQAKWTDEILDEAFRNLAANRPELDSTKLARTRQLMNAAVRDCLARGYEPLIPAIKGLPDPDDRHLLAAAIKARAQVIVTANLKDFRSEALAPWSTEAKHPDLSYLIRSTSTTRGSTPRSSKSPTEAHARR
jgi:predicted nucleic acid-binding protein